MEDQRIRPGSDYNNHPAPPEWFIQRDIWIIKVRYTYIYLSNLRAKKVWNTIILLKRGPSVRKGPKKTEFLLHKIWVKWIGNTRLLLLSTMSLSLTRIGNLLIHNKLFGGQGERGRWVKGKKVEQWSSNQRVLSVGPLIFQSEFKLFSWHRNRPGSKWFAFWGMRVPGKFSSMWFLETSPQGKNTATKLLTNTAI